jgi:hypothetical protein
MMIKYVSDKEQRGDTYLSPNRLPVLIEKQNPNRGRG